MRIETTYIDVTGKHHVTKEDAILADNVVYINNLVAAGTHAYRVKPGFDDNQVNIITNLIVGKSLTLLPILLTILIECAPKENLTVLDTVDIVTMLNALRAKIQQPLD